MLITSNWLQLSGQPHLSPGGDRMEEMLLLLVAKHHLLMASPPSSWPAPTLVARLPPARSQEPAARGQEPAAHAFPVLSTEPLWAS